MMSEQEKSPPVVIVAGPTASGKSALALELAERFDGEIVNADSMQVYRELPILTARPNTEDEARVPHHLYGVLAVDDVCSAGRWLEMAVEVIGDIHARHRLPVVCGGTGLYLKVLLEGIAPVPDIPDHVTAETRALAAELDGEAFRARLAAIDPDGAEHLQAADRQRLIRTFAVKTATGRTLAEWQAEQPVGPPLGARFLTLLLDPPRETLYARIDARFERMIEAGALDEVEACRERGLDPELPALKALGVPEFMRHLAGACGRDDAVDMAKQSTRNFAKRQYTWFRRQLEADRRLEDFGETVGVAASAAVDAFLGADGTC